MPLTMKRWFIRILYGVFTLAALAVLGQWGYQARIANVEAFPVQCVEGWAHRGYVDSTQQIQENSLQSYSRPLPWVRQVLK